MLQAKYIYYIFLGCWTDSVLSLEMKTRTVKWDYSDEFSGSDYDIYVVWVFFFKLADRLGLRKVRVHVNWIIQNRLKSQYRISFGMIPFYSRYNIWIKYVINWWWIKIAKRVKSTLEFLLIFLAMKLFFQYIITYGQLPEQAHMGYFYYRSCPCVR